MADIIEDWITTLSAFFKAETGTKDRANGLSLDKGNKSNLRFFMGLKILYGYTPYLSEEKIQRIDGFCNESYN
jgi:hypothetical protein